MATISLSGWAGCGKDSVADVLVREHGFKRYAWADTLRLAAKALNPIVASDGRHVPIRYNDVIEWHGYDEAKILYPEVRNVLQRLGTDVGRDLLGENIWVDATLRRITKDSHVEKNIVITDTRFLNEISAVKDMWWKSNLAVWVSREGVGPANDHISENALNEYNFDHVLYNDGGLDDLPAAVSVMLDHAK